MASEDRYSFDPEFERAAIALCCSRPRFYGRIGVALNPEFLDAPEAELILKAAQAIARVNGRGPSSNLIVIQRIRRWVDDGKVTLEQARDAVNYLDDAEDKGLPPEDDVADEIAPVLRTRAQEELVRTALDNHGKSNPAFFEKVRKAADKGERIGSVDTSVGIRIGLDSFDEIARLRRILRLPTGIMELDAELSGGLSRSSLGVVVGGAGDGKSMFLSHCAAHAMYEGQNVLYATLEIPEGEVLARMKANLTNIPIEAIVSDQAIDIAKKRLKILIDRVASDGNPSLGYGIVKEFPAYVTQVDDIREWVRNCEDTEGGKVDLLVIDYADRIGAGKSVGKTSSNYETMGVVYEGLRQVAVDNEFFCWTACQSTRNSKDRKKADVNHMSDSMHKGRIADLVVTLNVCGEENDEIEFFIAKHRTGKGKITVGPLPHDFTHGRVAPPSLREYGF